MLYYDIRTNIITIDNIEHEDTSIFKDIGITEIRTAIEIQNNAIGEILENIIPTMMEGL